MYCTRQPGHEPRLSTAGSCSKLARHGTAKREEARHDQFFFFLLKIVHPRNSLADPIIKAFFDKQGLGCI